MHKWVGSIVMLMSLAACQSDQTIVSQSVSSNGTVIRSKTITHSAGAEVTFGAGGIDINPADKAPTRHSDSQTNYLAGPFYQAAPDELCALATAALIYQRDRGATDPVDSLFWDRGVRIGPDCTADLATAGLPLALSFPGKETRRVIMPRALSDGRIFVEIETGCAHFCLLGDGYIVEKHEGTWQVAAEVDHWIR